MQPLQADSAIEQPTELSSSLENPLQSTKVRGNVSVVVPVYNALRYLPETVPALLRAAQQWGPAEIHFVDNGSTDGSYQYLRAFESTSVNVWQLGGGNVAAVRNYGAQRATGDFFSFLDADCVVGPNYFLAATEALDGSGAAATGCHVLVPETASWLVRVWHDLHHVADDRFVHYLNSGNFFITRAAFESVEGFDESMSTGEDAAIGLRLQQSGHQIYQSTKAEAVHLGNPSSAREFYRRMVWHSLGMFGTVRWTHVDKPTAMMMLHLLASLTGVIAMFSATASPVAGLLLLVLPQLLAPVFTVAFRMRQTRRPVAIAPAVFLYWLYYCARLQGFVLICAGRGRRYWK